MSGVVERVALLTIPVVCSGYLIHNIVRNVDQYAEDNIICLSFMRTEYQISRDIFSKTTGHNKTVLYYDIYTKKCKEEIEMNQEWKKQSFFKKLFQGSPSLCDSILRIEKAGAFTTATQQ
jgi:hypothetical protein